MSHHVLSEAQFNAHVGGCQKCADNAEADATDNWMASNQKATIDSNKELGEIRYWAAALHDDPNNGTRCDKHRD